MIHGSILTRPHWVLKLSEGLKKEIKIHFQIEIRITSILMDSDGD